MHVRRNVGAPKSPPHIVSPTTAPPIPSEPMAESIPAAPPAAPQRPPQVSASPFSNPSSVKATKLAALEASGIKTYALVSSPTVGKGSGSLCVFSSPFVLVILPQTRS